MKLKNCIFSTVCLSILSIPLILLWVHISYIPVREGTLYLQNANETSALLREKNTGIHHIKSQSLEQAIYTQGFAHAQDRLWQMEKQRRLVSGRLSEIFGEKSLYLDQFALIVGYRRVAEETWNSPNLLDEKSRKILQAYSDGVNDFLNGIGYFHDEITAFYLPPEFLALGITKIDPWHPIDSLALMRLINFHLSYNWSQDLLRDIFSNLEDGELKDLVDELVPYNSEFAYNLKSVLDEDDMKQDGLLFEGEHRNKSLLSRYKDKIKYDSDLIIQKEEINQKEEIDQKHTLIEEQKKDEDQDLNESSNDRQNLEIEQQELVEQQEENNEMKKDNEPQNDQESMEIDKKVKQENFEQIIESQNIEINKEDENQKDDNKQADEQTILQQKDENEIQIQENNSNLEDQQIINNNDQQYSQQSENDIIQQDLNDQKQQTDSIHQEAHDGKEDQQNTSEQDLKQEIIEQKQQIEQDENTSSNLQENNFDKERENEQKTQINMEQDAVDQIKDENIIVQEQIQNLINEEQQKVSQDSEIIEKVQSSEQQQQDQIIDEKLTEGKTSNQIQDEQNIVEQEIKIENNDDKEQTQQDFKNDFKDESNDQMKQNQEEETFQFHDDIDDESNDFTDPDDFEEQFDNEDIIENHSNLDDQFASNNWVISGKHTKNGLPLLSSDPHLGTGIPSFWILQHLQYQDNSQNKNKTEYVVGSSMPGVPLVLIGRTRHVSWGITASLTDVSDLYREKIRGDHYYLDGEWRPLKIENHKIQIKGNKTVDFQLRYTHRGPVMPANIIKNAQVLFGNRIPVHQDQGDFSLVWAGHIPGESLFDAIDNFLLQKNLFDIKEKMKKIDEWRSIPANIVMADRKGNIGYMLLSGSPKRKNEYPYLGCRIIDGQTSENDWDGLIKFRNLPISLNPKKGYYITANNRIVPESSKYDIGATMLSTGRSLRLQEIIDKGIQDGKKFTVKDMIDMQQDLVDTIARDLAPHIIKIVETVLSNQNIHYLNDKDVSDIKFMIDQIREFNGEMKEDSIPATVYSYWQIFFYGSLFKKYTTLGKNGKDLLNELENSKNNIQDKNKFWSIKQRLLMVDNYAFYDFYQRLIVRISNRENTEKYQKICELGYENDNYKGPSFCEHNIAKSFIEAKNFLNTHISMNKQKWNWGNVHVNEYPNHPWSLTPLKPFWHKEVKTGGNSNTPSVSKYSMSRVLDTKIFKSTHTANYKQVIQFEIDPSGQDDINLMSIDTGMNGNLFGGNYFNMNQRHLNGDLYNIELNFKKLESELEDGSKNYILHLKNIKQKKKIIIRSLEDSLVDEKFKIDSANSQKENLTEEYVYEEEYDNKSQIKVDIENKQKEQKQKNNQDSEQLDQSQQRQQQAPEQPQRRRKKNKIEDL